MRTSTVPRLALAMSLGLVIFFGLGCSKPERTFHVVQYVGTDIKPITGLHYYETDNIRWHSGGQISFIDKLTGNWMLVSGNYKVVMGKPNETSR